MTKIFPTLKTYFPERASFWLINLLDCYYTEMKELHCVEICKKKLMKHNLNAL